MRRIARNRGLAFLLTLSFLLASSASVAPHSFADNGDVVIGDPGGFSSPDPGDSGDPDGPGGPSKRSPTGGRRLGSSGGFYAVAPVGDGGAVMGVWSWRLHVVLRSLLSRWTRF
jgi:hypothetical protein